MIFTINVANYPLYQNSSAGERIVTVYVAGLANVEMKAPNGTPVLQQRLGALGGIIALRVPPQHFVEIDAPQTGVQVEVQTTD